MKVPNADNFIPETLAALPFVEDCTLIMMLGRMSCG